eukprot:TRINITY_DN1205_c0_g1_i1.p1 TRINITY_DN1205_c0_g1~~TRINITY_DN1205_c0_g1_i1.p1  ORF type:complete len:140 (-),score=18.11 TRINITY_DN1205_c0_g1_i1:74-493(-)
MRILFILTLFLFYTFASDVCECKCCDAAQTMCLEKVNNTFSIDDCNFCTQDYCNLLFPKECSDDKSEEMSFVKASCIDRDNPTTKVFVVTYSVLVIILLICAIFKITGHLDQMTDWLKLKMPFIHTWHERYKNKKTFLL